MKKIKIIGVILTSVLILMSTGPFTIAQNPSYVGVSEGEEYVWNFQLKKEGINSIKTDFETFVNNLLDEILAWDLGAYTNLNVSEAMLLATDDSIELFNNTFLPGIIPQDWKTVNFSTFMETLFDNVVETLNNTVLSGTIPSDWRSNNIDLFFENIIDGLNKTVPGFEDLTLSELFELAIDIVNDTIAPFGSLPVGWEAMTMDELIELSLGNVFDFINTTILTGMVPSGWLHMNVSQLLHQMFPIIPQWVIDQMDASFAYSGLNEVSIFTLYFDMYVQSINYSLGIIPGDWKDRTLSGLITPILFYGYENYNITYFVDDIFESINSSTPFDLYALNMSEIINMTIYGLSGGFSPEQQAMPLLDLYTDMVDMTIYAVNASYPEGTFPDGWMSLSIDNLRAYYIDESRTLFDLYMDEVDNIISQFELLEGFGEYGLKIRIDHIGSEVELILGGPRGVPINLSILFKMPMSDEWVNLIDIIGGDIFQYYTLYILDPTSFPASQSALFEQFFSTAGLIIGKGYDWSSISKELEFPGPGIDKLMKFSMDWDVKGVLDHMTVSYEDQTVAYIELQTEAEPEGKIPGYEVIILLGTMLFSVGTMVYFIKKKKKIN